MKRNLFILVAAIILTIAWDYVSSFLLGGMNLFQRALWQVVGWIIATLVILIFNKGSRSIWVMYAGLITLVVLFLPDSALLAFSNRETLAGPTGTMMLVVFPVTIVLAAILLYSGIAIQNDSFINGNANSPSENTSRLSASLLILGVLLLLKLLDSFYRFMVWDTTYDPLGIFWLFFPTMAVMLAGMAFLGFLPGSKKWVGVLFFLLIPAFFVIANRAESVGFRQLTEGRAERVRVAIEAFHTQEGVYPESLGQLFPRYGLSLSNPVILFGQGWCYEGGGDYYRLGYLNRDHWSSPILYGKVYASGGHSPSRTDVCQSAIDRYHVSNPGWEKTLRDYGYPTPTPDLGE